MVAWLTRMMLIGGGAVTSWFVAKEAPNYSVIQGIVTMLLIALVVAVLAYWPARWSTRLNRLGKSRR
jgi:hypothetical protein